MKAAIFDLDGTLVDSMGDIAEATNYAMEVLGYRTYTVEEYKTLAGGGNKPLVTNTLRVQMDTEPDADLIEKAVDLKVQYENGPHGHAHTEAFPGAYDMLRELKNAGVQLAVLSNKTEKHVRSIVKKCFPDIEWSYVAGARDDTPLKPDPTAALNIVNHYMPGIEPADVVFVGDTDYDMKTGKTAGMTPLGVPWGCRKADELMQYGAAKVVSDHTDITNFVITQSC